MPLLTSKVLLVLSSAYLFRVFFCFCFCLCFCLHFPGNDATEQPKSSVMPRDVQSSQLPQTVNYILILIMCPNYICFHIPTPVRILVHYKPLYMTLYSFVTNENN